MNSYEKWLRQAAAEIVAAGHNGWGNACIEGAGEIERLTAEITGMRSPRYLRVAQKMEVEYERLQETVTSLTAERESYRRLTVWAISLLGGAYEIGNFPNEVVDWLNDARRAVAHTRNEEKTDG